MFLFFLGGRKVGGKTQKLSRAISFWRMWVALKRAGGVWVDWPGCGGCCLQPVLGDRQPHLMVEVLSQRVLNSVEGIAEDGPVHQVVQEPMVCLFCVELLDKLFHDSDLTEIDPGLFVVVSDQLLRAGAQTLMVIL